MADYLMRDQVPLSEEQWDQIDAMVMDVARRNLVGRRVIPLFGPFGPGVQTIHVDQFTGGEQGTVSLMGDDEAGTVTMGKRDHLPLPMIYKDFQIHWRDLETASQLRLPLDVSPAAAAAAFCARAEDDLIFNGHKANGHAYAGLTNAPGRNAIAMRDWSETGNAFRDVVEATQMLVANEFYGPFALVVSPALYAGLNRIHDGTGVLELEQVRKIATAGVYQTPVLGNNVAVVLSVGSENMDLAVAQDLITAFLETSAM
ncbi:MAG TPA: family 1 encapsulin nanocompartment shell protein, partial [Armatimonadota bacterium]|nr:family 1 encapsulin nanocompartment shell protein [Armatimonadota bacterium]